MILDPLALNPTALDPKLRTHALDPIVEDLASPPCRSATHGYTCTFLPCQVCFDSASKGGAELSGCSGNHGFKDSLASLLHEISQAVHDDEGDAHDDDMGEAIADVDDEDVDVAQLFKDAQRFTASQQLQDQQRGEGGRDNDDDEFSFDDDPQEY